MFLEKTTRKSLRFDLNDSGDRTEYDKVLNDPAVKIISKDLVTETETHIEKDYSTSQTHHVILLEVEECGF